MGLDYTAGCVNFRDVGGYINIIEGKNILPEGKIFRGGSIDYIESLHEISNVRSIINLRNGNDPQDFDANYYHFPIANKIEKYDTSQKEVRVWINSVLKVFEDENFEFPVLIHCLSGKDRTGIIMSALLLILGISESSIEEEYLLSNGEVDLKLIRQSITGIKNTNSYFNRINIEKIKRHFY